MLRLRFSPMSWLLSEHEMLLQLALNYASQLLMYILDRARYDKHTLPEVTRKLSWFGLLGDGVGGGSIRGLASISVSPRI